MKDHEAFLQGAAFAYADAESVLRTASEIMTGTKEANAINTLWKLFQEKVANVEEKLRRAK